MPSKTGFKTGTSRKYFKSEVSNQLLPIFYDDIRIGRFPLSVECTSYIGTCSILNNSTRVVYVVPGIFGSLFFG